jgi:hypothetical protein
MLEAWWYLDNAPKKAIWTTAVKRKIHEHWSKPIVESIPYYNGLRYLSCVNLDKGKLHPILKISCSSKGDLHRLPTKLKLLRDQPFNLQGGGGGVWFFVSFRNVFSDNTRARIFIFFTEFNIRLYDKNSESHYFFSSTKIRIFFSSTLGIRIFFLEKKPQLSTYICCFLNVFSTIFRFSTYWFDA